MAQRVSVRHKLCIHKIHKLTHTHTDRLPFYTRCECVCVCVIMCLLKLVQCVSVSGRQAAGRQRISCIPPRIAHTPRCQLLLCFIASSSFFSFFLCLLAFCLVSLRPQSSAQILTTSIAIAHLILAIGLATGSLLCPSPLSSLPRLCSPALLSFSSLAPLQMKICSVWFISLSLLQFHVKASRSTRPTTLAPPHTCYE